LGEAARVGFSQQNFERLKMPNKNFESLWEADKFIRQLYPVGMNAGVQLKIEFISGFELFNTRPYHNYETWSDGYRISDGHITVEAEDLDDALRLFKAKLEERNVI
jgi:hypothetical protein